MVKVGLRVDSFGRLGSDGVSAAFIYFKNPTITNKFMGKESPEFPLSNDMLVGQHQISKSTQIVDISNPLPNAAPRPSVRPSVRQNGSLF
jgi:hypothetical protein